MERRLHFGPYYHPGCSLGVVGQKQCAAESSIMSLAEVQTMEVSIRFNIPQRCFFQWSLPAASAALIAEF